MTDAKKLAYSMLDNELFDDDTAAVDYAVLIEQAFETYLPTIDDPEERAQAEKLARNLERGFRELEAAERYAPA